LSKAINKEIASFEGLWPGGYYEGDPLDPLGRSNYGGYGYLSVLHATYLFCIRPYITSTSKVLEIGPGRGAWTKTMLDAAEVWCLDALSAEHNGFNQYVGAHDNVRYIQVGDFECKDLPDDYFTFMFSFGTLCHVSPEGVAEYARNLFPKMTSGSDCFWFISDKSKYEAFIERRNSFDIWRAIAPKRASLLPVRKLLELFSKFSSPTFSANFDDFEDGPGKWYEGGVGKTCEMLVNAGYKILNPDVGILTRDAIIHFTKP